MHSEVLLGGPTGRIIGGLYYVNHKAEIAVLRSSFIVQSTRGKSVRQGGGYYHVGDRR